MAENIPAAEIDVDAALVRALLHDQHGDLADRPLTPVAFGWDNVIFRLGDDLTVRLPRRELAAHLVEHEQRWLPKLATFGLPIPIPAPVRVGRPALGYPWSWSVCPWFPGRRAADTAFDELDETADLLGRFVGALHRDAPPDAPHNPYRGIPLADRTEQLQSCLQILGPAFPEARAVQELWDDLVVSPPWSGPPQWLHGDLHPANILVDHGRVSAVIDFGDITAGDPATDLAVAWMLLPPSSWPVLRAAAGGIDDDTWTRARAWALGFALMLLARTADEPSLRGVGERTLPIVLAHG